MDLDSEIQGSGKIDASVSRQLVLDYLLHNCYGETARAFMKDDLDAAKEASENRRHGFRGNSSNNSNSNSTTNNGSNGMTNGNGSSANGHSQGGVMTRSIDDHHGRPTHVSTLSRIHSLPSTGSSVSLMAIDSDRPLTSALEDQLDQEGDSPMGETYLEPPSKENNVHLGTFTADKALALQIDEQLKNLETRKAIRSLISNGDIGPAEELCNSAFPGVLSIDPHSTLTTPASIHMNFKMQCQKYIEIVKSDPERGPEALMFAQQVVHDFTQLDPSSKDQYLKYMEEIVTVIAYLKPEEAPNGYYFRQEARDRLADMMNSSVLGCNGMSCEPALLTIVKQTTLVREMLNEYAKSKRSKAPPKWHLSKFLEESG
ncbi:Glucose-induced degradation complex subunit [Lunasporangiospora selenospora]|uniref:Glucose-induced degradation complex subunit n=1 Tax=Lunasporangiospora selenospora TaxID=979761 RepID=A0A9P6KBC9_9FUNG|nr:Glucose-induced degradation complex subunit [Lunasporangiospora selenospora]